MLHKAAPQMVEALRYLRPRIEAVMRAHRQCAEKAARTEGERHKASNYNGQADGEQMMLDQIDTALRAAGVEP